MHAKRFEHSGGPRALAKKLDTFLSFPLENLDMSPYLTGNALRERHVARPTPPTKASMKSTETATATATTTPGQSRAVSAVGESLRRTRSHNTVPSGTAVAEKSGGGGRSFRMGKCASVSAMKNGGGNGDDGQDSVPKPDTSTGVEGAGGGTSNATSSAAAALTGHQVRDLNNDPSTNHPRPSSCMYDLFSVVCHRGSFQGGHYVAYIRASNGQWYLCDDAYVAPVSDEVVRTCQAYMMFYAQQELVPWRNTEKQGNTQTAMDK